MQVGDVPEACALLNEIIRMGGTTAIESGLSQAEFALWYLQGEDMIACHVALDPEGRVAGFQWMGRNPDLPPDCADIASFTRRERPLRGAGRALFAVTCEFAKDAGLAQINATIRADNVPGLGYYTGMGFQDHSVAPGVPLSDGTLVDRISKRYLLE